MLGLWMRVLVSRTPVGIMVMKEEGTRDYLDSFDVSLTSPVCTSHVCRVKLFRRLHHLILNMEY